MKTGKTYYSILEIAPDATEDDIKRAYRTLARKYHPDSGGMDSSHDNFSQITEAYNVLSNPEERKHYDFKIGITSEKQKKVKTYTEEAEKDLLRRMRSQAPEDATDIDNKEPPEPSAAKNFFNKITESIKRPPPSEPHSKKADPNPPPRQPKGDKASANKFGDIRGERVFRFVIDGLESITGTTREVALEGSDGPRIIRVRVPAGVLPGQVIRINCPARGKDKQTTIKVTVDIAPHHLIERDGYDVIVKVPITFGEAINGTSLEAPGLNETVPITLPPMWSSEKRIRLKGKGVPHQDDPNTRGDLYIQTYVVIPERASSLLSEAARAVEPNYLTHPRAALPKIFTAGD